MKRIDNIKANKYIIIKKEFKIFIIINNNINEWFQRFISK